MKRLISISLGILTVLCLMVAMDGRAWGYVDPGTGFVALQTFASVAAASTYFLRRRIMTLFGVKKGPATASVPAIDAKEGSSQRAA